MSVLELVGLVPAGAAAGSMLIVSGLNLLAGMERRLLAEPAPPPAAVAVTPPPPVAVAVMPPPPVAAEPTVTTIVAPGPPPALAVRVTAPPGPLRPGRRLAQGRAYIGVRLRCQRPVRPPPR